MAESAKAIGLRLPAQVWAEVEKYGLEHHPGGRGDKGFDLTQALIKLISKGLGLEKESNNSNSDTELNKRITEIVRQQLDIELDKRILEIVVQQFNGSDTVVEIDPELNIVIQELTQKELAERLKASASTLSRAVKGGDLAWKTFKAKYPDSEGLVWEPPAEAGGKFWVRH